LKLKELDPSCGQRRLAGSIAEELSGPQARTLVATSFVINGLSACKIVAAALWRWNGRPRRA